MADSVFSDAESAVFIYQLSLYVEEIRNWHACEARRW